MNFWRAIARGREGAGAVEYMLGVTLVVLVMVASLSLLVPYLQRGLLGLGQGLRSEDYKSIGTDEGKGGGSWSPGTSPYWQSGQDGHSWVGGEDKLGIAKLPANIASLREQTPKIAFSAMDYLKLADFNTSVMEKNLPGKWEVVDVSRGDYADYGITPEMLSGKWWDGFEARLYYNPDTNQYVCAFEGTSPLSVPDWLNDVAQGSGIYSIQYERAIKLADALNGMANNKGADLEFVGHSLGGGLASASSIATGRKAVTFNAAGLNYNTVSDRVGSYQEMHEKGAQLIKAYYIEGEVLSSLQDSKTVDLAMILPGTSPIALYNAHTNDGDVLPEAVGTRIKLEAPTWSVGGIEVPRDPISLHLMPSLYDALGTTTNSSNPIMQEKSWAYHREVADEPNFRAMWRRPARCSRLEGGKGLT